MRFKKSPCVSVVVMSGQLVIAIASLALSLRAQDTGAGLDSKPADNVVVRGIVTDEADQPLAGASVGAVLLSHRSPTDPLAGNTIAVEVGRTATNEHGAFDLQLRKVTKQDIALELSAGATGFGPAFLDLGITKTRHDLTMKLPKAATVAVKVLAPNGEPLPKAALKLYGLLVPVEGSDAPAWYTAPENGASAWPSPDVTAADGATSLVGAESISKMGLEIDDHRVARQRWIISTARQSGPMTLRTEPPRNVDGQVIGRDTGSPLEEVVVKLTSWANDNFAGAVFARTGKDGRFAVRPYVGEELDILATSPGTRYLPLNRRIPWIEGTATQQMVLRVYGKGFGPEDGTTPDGRLATTIDANYPTAEVIESRPDQPLEGPLSGTLFAEAALTALDHEAPVEVRGVIAIDPATGRWRLIAENGREPRVSPSGALLSYSIPGDGNRLHIRALNPPGESRTMLEQCVGPASWFPSNDRLAVNIRDPKPQRYDGQMYWPTGREKYRLSVQGEKLAAIDLPTPYEAFDVSRDGEWIAMHWDTHASLTGAQLYVAKVDGRDLKAIAQKRHQYYWYPRFSPDGKSVVAKHLDANNGRFTVRVLSLDGSSERSISLGERYIPEVACWSPNGSCVAIAAHGAEAASGGKKVSRIFIADSVGRRLTEVKLRQADVLQIGHIDWTPAAPTLE